MFCPGCGSEDHQASQFCRACGMDLRVLRVGIERPDAVTASAVSAREEIGRAVAERIREMEDPRYLRRFARLVLPKIEKFLESPEEKRLRRLRSGMITGLIGLAVAIPAIPIVANIHDTDAQIFLMYIIVAGAVTFATGLGLLLNGLLFSKPRKGVEDRSAEAQQQQLVDLGYAPPLRANSEPALLRAGTTSNLAKSPGVSVTENTTQHLKSQRR
jgi:hypothetical protein